MSAYPTCPCGVAVYRADGSVQQAFFFQGGQDGALSRTLDLHPIWAALDGMVDARKLAPVDPATFTSGDAAPLLP